jgi:hypothetical protein
MSNLTESTSDRLGELLRHETPPHSRQAHLEGRARLIASVERMRGEGRRRAVAVLCVTAAAAALAAVFIRHGSAPPIAWHVEDGAVEAQGYISVASTAPDTHLVFDDGSGVTLGAGSRGRVESTSANGAEVVLEQGRANVHVQHRDRTAWTIDAGPYAVHVTGTDFFVAWAADSETLDVWMLSGRIVVTGPVLGDEVTLSAGKHLTASPRDRTSRVDDSPAPSSWPSPPAGPDVSQSPAPPVDALAEVADDAKLVAHQAEEASPATSALSGPMVSWSKRVGAGDYARVVQDAERQGIGRAIATRPLVDLRALGDAARYAGRSDIAERAYMTIRERFASSTEARTAAFLLGRVEEEQQHSNAEALRWYDAYVAEAPTGAFAGDALGRKMILVSRSQGREAAKPVAQLYLARFPSGPYAAAARDLSP